MQTQTHLPHALPQNLVDHTLSNEPFRDKAAINVVLEPSQLKLLRYLERNTPPVRYYTIQRLSDSKLYCKETGQNFPLKTQDKLNKKQLLIEIAHKILSEIQP